MGKDIITSDRFDIEDLSCEEFVLEFSDLDDFIKSFRESFKYIIVYHGTNLSESEVVDVRLNGLKKSTVELLAKKAKERFIDGKWENIEMIKKDIDKYFSKNNIHTNNEINFALIKDNLWEHYHYILFGSEALFPVADYLKEKYRKPFRRILVESGLHYIVKAIIPVEKIDDYWIECIYDYFHDSCSSITIVFKENLPSTYILEIENVVRPDDLQGLLLI